MLPGPWPVWCCCIAKPLPLFRSGFTPFLQSCLLLQDLLVSKISRKSIELLKKHFMDDMTRDDWRLVVKLKKTFQID